MWHIGVDEAGRGPVIGPLVVACFTCPEEDLHLLVKAGVKDSKKLSPERREKLEKWLRKESELRDWYFFIYSSSPAAIDNAMQRGNLNEHECILFSHVINKLPILKGSGILELDACDTDPLRFAENVCKRIKNWPWRNWDVDSRHGADNIHPAVGAASILAKTTRDNKIQELSKLKGFDLGSGYPSDEKTKLAVRKLIDKGICDPDLRWRWQTVTDAWKENNQGMPPTRPITENGELQPPQKTLF